MKRGEITGHFFNTARSEVGMPLRPQSTTRREERKAITKFDDDMEQADSSLASFDPFNIPNEHLIERKHKTNPTQDRFVPSGLKNISYYDTDYINTLSFNIYNELIKNTISNFCIFPVGILSSFIKDPTIDQILSTITTQEIFFQTQLQHKIVNSRSAVSINVPQKLIINKFTYYEDNENQIVEYPLNDEKFAIGFICNKNDNEIELTDKLYTGYMSNLKRTKINIYCPPFVIKNKINLNETLLSLDYIASDNIRYLQTIYLNSHQNIFIKTTTSQNQIDVSNNFVFYIRYVPNNVILFIGRCNNFNTDISV